MRPFLSLSLCLCYCAILGQPSTEGKAFIFPAFTLQNPSNPGKLGIISVGGVVQDKTRLGKETDANAEVYIGLGKPEKVLGAGITLNIHGLTNSIGERNNLGKGTASFHLNRFVFDKKLLLDVGVDNAFLWGDAKSSQHYITYQPSFFIAGNYLFDLGSPRWDKPFGYVSLTLGAGNGYYRKDHHATQIKSGSLNPFFSLATPLLRGTNAIAEWNGYDIGVGLSSIPLQKLPLAFRVEATDFILGKPRFIASVFLSFFIHQKGVPSFERPIGTKAIRPARTI
jgi:hypothetical protein